VSTKEKAQEFVGLNMDEIRKKKEEFIKNVLPEWDKNNPEGTGKKY
jgi:nitrite reductase (cytochrome c-552)